MAFHWSLIDSKSPQVSRTLLSILAVLNNAVTSIISTRPPTSKSSRPFNSPLFYCAKSANHNWYNWPFHIPQIFQFSCKVEELILLFTFFQFYSVVNQDGKVNNFANALLICWLLLGLVSWPRLSNPALLEPHTLIV